MIVNYELKRKTDLLYLLIQKEVTIQYKRTTLGILWTLIDPILSAAVFYIAFTVILKYNIQNYTLFLLSALFPWTLFSNSIILSTNVLITNKSLIKKIPFPRHFLLLAVVTAQCIHFLFSIPITIFLVYYYGNTISLIWVLGIPVLILIQLALTLGFSFVVSTINVYFRDMQYIIAFIINMLFWLTPILYSVDTIPAQYRYLFLNFNPLTRLICSWRELFMFNILNWENIGFCFAISLSILFIGIVFFQRFGKRIDEVI